MSSESLIRQNVKALVDVISNDNDAKPEHFRILGELMAQVLVDIHRIANALERSNTMSLR